jgi:hypothetical protein
LLFDLILFSFVDFFLIAVYCITFLFVVALNKALARVAYLEAKLKTTFQALKDANIAKDSAEKAAKTAIAKAKKAEKALAEITQKQSNCEGAVIERLDAICTSVGSKFFILSLCLAKVVSVDMLFLTCTSVMQQSDLERSGNSGSKVPKTLWWTRLTFWSQNGVFLEISSSKLTIFFLAYSSGYFRGRRKNCCRQSQEAG